MKIKIVIQDWVADFPLSHDGVETAKIWLDNMAKELNLQTSDESGDKNE